MPSERRTSLTHAFLLAAAGALAAGRASGQEVPELQPTSVASEDDAVRQGAKALDSAESLIQAVLGPSGVCREYSLKKLSVPAEQLNEAVLAEKAAFWRKALRAYVQDVPEEERVSGERAVMRLAMRDGKGGFNYRHGINQVDFMRRFYIRSSEAAEPRRALRKLLKESLWTWQYFGYEDHNSDTIGSDLFIFNFAPYPDNDPTPLLVFQIHYCEG